MNNKRYKFFIAIISVLLTGVFISAVKDANVTDVGDIPPPQTDYSPATDDHDVGLFLLSIHNDNEEGTRGGVDPNYPGNWPSEEGSAYAYHSTLWCGWENENETKTVAHSYYGAYDWIPESTIEGISNPSNTDQPMSDGNWPSEGPDIEVVSDLDSWIWVTDVGNEVPIGVWCVRHGYQWAVDDHNDFIVFHYTIKNTSGNTLDDLFFAARNDMDIGGGLDFDDDLVGYEGNDTTDEWTNPTEPGAVWTEQTPDGIPDEYDYVNFDENNGFPEGFSRGCSYMFDSEGDPVGYHGVRIFGYWRTFDEDWDYDNPQNNEPDPEYWVKVTSQHSWDINNDPENDSAKYGYMSDTGTFMEVPDTPFDWRVCPAIGPLEDVDDGEQIDFYFVECVSEDLLELRRNLDQCVYDFLGPDGIPYSNDDWVVAGAPPSPLLVAIPKDIRVELHFNPNYKPGHNTETEPDPQNDDPDTGEKNIVDFDGYIIWRSAVGFDQGWEPIFWYDKLTTDLTNCYKPWGWRDNGGTGDKAERIPTGAGPTEPDLETVYNAGQFMSHQDLVDETPSDQEYYEFVDVGQYSQDSGFSIKNGFRYFYAVTPYDFGAILNDSDGSDENDIYITPVVAGKTANQTYAIPLPVAGEDLSDVVVVPNPYIGSADWEGWAPSKVRENRIAFMNVPEKCTIRIYTLSGDWVDTIEHSSTAGVAYWDMANFATEIGLRIASGVYIYQIEAPNSDPVIGKFAIIMGE